MLSACPPHPHPVTEKAKNELIAKILAHLDDIDFLHHQTEIDVLGDAYEYLIGQFAAGSGKKAGEFYTPQQISTILSEIVTLDSQEPKTGKKGKDKELEDLRKALWYLEHHIKTIEEKNRS